MTTKQYATQFLNMLWTLVFLSFWDHSTCALTYLLIFYCWWPSISWHSYLCMDLSASAPPLPQSTPSTHSFTFPPINSIQGLCSESDWSLMTLQLSLNSISALTLLAGWQEEHLASKKTEWWGAGIVVICLEQGANDWHIVQLIPLPPHHLLLP